MNNFQRNCNQNTASFIKENEFDNVLYKMAAICLGFIVLITIGNHPKFHPNMLID